MSRLNAINSAKRETAEESALTAQKNIVLFVCTGNTCRSPMAQALFNKKAETMPGERWYARSAGVAAKAGSAASEHVVNLLADQGIALKDHLAKQLSREMMSEATVVITMNSVQRDLLLLYFPEYEEKIFSIADYTGSGEDVADPYGGDEEDYAKTLGQLTELIDKIFDRLLSKDLYID